MICVHGPSCDSFQRETKKKQQRGDRVDGEEWGLSNVEGKGPPFSRLPNRGGT